MFELVLASVASTYFVTLISGYGVAHFFGIGREQQPNQE